LASGVGYNFDGAGTLNHLAGKTHVAVITGGVAELALRAW
jgi:hypothetical protein